MATDSSSDCFSYTMVFPTIIIIEDDCDDADFLTQAFNEVSPGHVTICFTSAEKLFVHLDTLGQKEFPCLIVIDVNIPLINGIAILDMLQTNERYASIPRLVYSHSSNPRDRQDSFAAGALTYINKSNSMAEIRKNVVEMLSYCK
jgi:two-component system, chemotaxis family, chemotaxis protein CheY